MIRAMAGKDVMKMRMLLNRIIRVIERRKDFHIRHAKPAPMR